MNEERQNQINANASLAKKFLIGTGVLTLGAMIGGGVMGAKPDKLDDAEALGAEAALIAGAGVLRLKATQKIAAIKYDISGDEKTNEQMEKIINLQYRQYGHPIPGGNAAFGAASAAVAVAGPKLINMNLPTGGAAFAGGTAFGTGLVGIGIAGLTGVGRAVSEYKQLSDIQALCPKTDDAPTTGAKATPVVAPKMKV